MARRKTTKRRRPSRYKSAFNLKNLIFSYAGLSIATKAFLNTTPTTFLLGGYVPGFDASGVTGGGSGSGLSVTLHELVQGIQEGGHGLSPFDQIWANARNNLGMFVISSIALKVTETLVTKLGVSKAFNRTIRSVGMGDVVKM